MEGHGAAYTVPITEKDLTMDDYAKEPVEVIKVKTWVVYDPWLAQDIGVFTSREAAEMFAQVWMERG